MNKYLVALGAVCAIFSAEAGSAADLPAYGFDNAPASNDTQLSLGFSFTLNSAVKVTSLGYYDFGGDGFATAHDVGIFDSAGALLASANLSVGTGDALTGQFRYADITPLNLSAGQTYVIAATTHGGSDAWAYGNAYPSGATVSDFKTAAPIAITANSALFLYQNDDVLRKPTDHYSNYTFYAGPNFTILDVPEPASWTMMLGGFGLIGGLLRSRRRSVISLA